MSYHANNPIHLSLLVDDRRPLFGAVGQYNGEDFTIVLYSDHVCWAYASVYVQHMKHLGTRETPLGIGHVVAARDGKPVVLFQDTESFRCFGDMAELDAWAEPVGEKAEGI